MTKYHAHFLRDGSNMSVSGATIEAVIKKMKSLDKRMFKNYGLMTKSDYSISHLNENKKVWIKDCIVKKGVNND